MEVEFTFDVCCRSLDEHIPSIPISIIEIVPRAMSLCLWNSCRLDASICNRYVIQLLYNYFNSSFLFIAYYLFNQYIFNRVNIIIESFWRKTILFSLLTYLVVKITGKSYREFLEWNFLLMLSLIILQVSFFFLIIIDTFIIKIFIFFYIFLEANCR